MTASSPLRKHLSFANVTAMTALFVAIGGSSYAALRVGSAEIIDNSVRSVDLRNNHIRSRDIRNGTIRGRDIARATLGGREIRESRLGLVPRASEANRVGGLRATDLRLRCPGTTVAKLGVCIEGSPRSPATLGAAVAECDQAGRGLPDYVELSRLNQTSRVSPAGEWTSSVYRNPDPPDAPASQQLEVVVVTPSIEGIEFRRALTPEQRPFRCVALPSN